jgi:4-hydroxy-4-methyl-2-oxoglutarate aldolase
MPTFHPLGIMKIIRCFLLAALFFPVNVHAQTISQDQMIFYTAEWEGERFPDGRPRVPDEILERMEKISIEEAWGVMRRHGFHNQFEGNWEMIFDDRPVVGRALTAVYMPMRPDLNNRILEKGHNEGRKGNSNSWPIDMLSNGDVYVADAYGKVIDGTLIGDNLGNSIYAKSQKGVIFDGGLRDLAGLEKIDGFNAFVRGWDPSFLQETMLMQMNVPIRIGRVTVLPGDVVLAKREGVIFVPAHLAEEVVVSAEIIGLRDTFGHQRLRQGRYTPGEIDSAWSDEIKADFLEWVDAHPEHLATTKEELLKELKTRGW